MKALLPMMILFAATSASAKGPTILNNQKGELSAACKSKIEKLIRTTASSMGLNEKYGFSLNSELSEDKSTWTVATGVFIINDGYLSDTGATLTVKQTAKDCIIQKMDLSIGK